MGDTIGMSHKPPITDEQLAALPPEIQTLIRAIIDHYEARIAELEAKLAKTPQNRPVPKIDRTGNLASEAEELKSERGRILVVRYERQEDEQRMFAAKAQLSAMFVLGAERERSWRLVVARVADGRVASFVTPLCDCSF